MTLDEEISHSESNNYDQMLTSKHKVFWHILHTEGNRIWFLGGAIITLPGYQYK